MRPHPMRPNCSNMREPVFLQSLHLAVSFLSVVQWVSAKNFIERTELLQIIKCSLDMRLRRMALKVYIKIVFPLS